MKKRDVLRPRGMIRIGKHWWDMWPSFIIVDKPYKRFQITQHELRSAQGFKSIYKYPENITSKEALEMAFKQGEEFMRFMAEISLEKAGMELHLKHK